MMGVGSMGFGRGRRRSDKGEDVVGPTRETITFEGDGAPGVICFALPTPYSIVPWRRSVLGSRG